MSDESPEAPKASSKTEAPKSSASDKEPAAVVLRVVGPVGVSAFDNGDLVFDRNGTAVSADDAEDTINAAARSGVILEVSE